LSHRGRNSVDTPPPALVFGRPATEGPSGAGGPWWAAGRGARSVRPSSVESLERADRRRNAYLDAGDRVRAIPAEGKLVLALALLLGWLYLSARYGGLIAWLDRHMPDSEPRRWR